MKNYLSLILANFVDEDHLPLLLQIDENLRKNFDEMADEVHRTFMNEFERSPSTNDVTEFIIFLSILQATVQDIEERKL